MLLSPRARDVLKQIPLLTVFVRNTRAMKWRALRLLDSRLSVPPRGEIVIAGMATMPSRASTFQVAFRSIIRQVDHLYVYLDGFDVIPLFLQDRPDVSVILSRDEPGLHANGKLLGLHRHPGECAYVTVDDDIYYKRQFVASLLDALNRQSGVSIVGLHGSNLSRPGIDADSLPLQWYASTLDADIRVDVLGTGAVLFRKGSIPIDVSQWPDISMTDLGVALAAARCGVPMLSIRRKRPVTVPLASNQSDSLFRSRQVTGGIQERNQERVAREVVQALSGKVSE